MLWVVQHSSRLEWLDGRPRLVGNRPTASAARAAVESAWPRAGERRRWVMSSSSSTAAAAAGRGVPGWGRRNRAAETAGGGEGGLSSTAAPFLANATASPVLPVPLSGREGERGRSGTGRGSRIGNTEGRAPARDAVLGEAGGAGPPCPPSGFKVSAASSEEWLRRDTWRGLRSKSAAGAGGGPAPVMPGAAVLPAPASRASHRHGGAGLA